MAANIYPGPHGNAFNDLQRAFNNHAALIDGLTAGGTAEADRYVWHEVTALNTPFQVPENYANIVAVYTQTGPTTVVLPDNPTETQRLVSVVDVNGNAPQNPITIEHNSNTLFVIDRAGGRAVLAYDPIQNTYQPLTLDALFIFLSKMDFYATIDVGSVTDTVAFTMQSPFGPGPFSFIPLSIDVIKATGANWTTAPIVSVGFTAPNYNNIMAAQNLGTTPGAGRHQLVATKLTVPNGTAVSLRTLQAGAVASGDPLVDVYLTGFWTVLPNN